MLSPDEADEISIADLAYTIADCMDFPVHHALNAHTHKHTVMEGARRRERARIFKFLELCTLACPGHPDSRLHFL